MTATFDALGEEPQTEIDIATLAPDERMAIRQIQISSSPGTTANTSVGSFTSVFYLSGDEKRAAEQFVAENRSALSKLDFSGQNLLSTNVDREIYDWILHALGERELELYETVVIERRADGPTWCVGRQTFEETPLRRYTTAGGGSAKIDGVDLAALYESYEELITESALAAKPSVAGDPRIVLDAFRNASTFDCRPTTVDGELAIRKVNAVENTEKCRCD